jgi:large subunit ribosomal protein L29
MRVNEVRELNSEELYETLDEQQRALMNLRFRAATLQLPDFTEIKRTRRTIARIKTVMAERVIAARGK